jgi:hypothetical protein
MKDMRQEFASAEAEAEAAGEEAEAEGWAPEWVQAKRSGRRRSPIPRHLRKLAEQLSPTTNTIFVDSYKPQGCLSPSLHLSWRTATETGARNAAIGKVRNGL